MYIFIVLFFIIALVLFTNYYIKYNTLIPREYKFIPRTLEQRFDEPIAANILYGDIFRFASPFLKEQEFTNNKSEDDTVIDKVDDIRVVDADDSNSDETRYTTEAFADTGLKYSNNNKHEWWE